MKHELTMAAASLTRRVLPLLAAMTLYRVLSVSTVTIKLFSWPELVSRGIVWSYIAVLVVLAVDRTTNPRVLGVMHAVASALAVLTFGGRAWGFLSLLSVDASLEAAVWERALLLAFALQYHYRQAKELS